MTSSTLIFLILSLTCVWAKIKLINYENELEDEVIYPKNFTTLKTLKEFVNLVNENKLNVSLIVSAGKNYDDNNLKEVMAMTITFPVQEPTVTKDSLDKEDLRKLTKVANEEKITVAGTKATNNHLTIISNNLPGIPLTKAYKIFTGIKNGKTGFVFDEKNYVAQYTFLQNDGKKVTKVLHGDADIEVVDKSSNLKGETLSKIKQAVIDAIVTFDEEYVPRGITAYLTKELPGKNWDAASEVGNYSCLGIDEWVQLKVVNEYYLVYST